MDDSPHAHPSEELLKAYASGWLCGAPALCIAVHLGACARCAAASARADEAQAAFVDLLPEAPLPADKLQALVSKLKATPVEAPAAARKIGDVELPPALRRTAIGRRRWAGPGLWIAPLREARVDGWRAYLIRIPPDQAMPVHGHNGPEFIAVLSGAFRDSATYRAGDFVEVAAEATHRLQVVGDAPCACLVAHKGPLALKGLASLLQAAFPV